MNNDKNNRRDNENNFSRDNANRADLNRSEINHATRSWEESRNPDSDSDRKGRNVDMDLENQKNEIKGREQQTTPKSTTDQLVDRFNRRDEDRNSNS